MAIATGKKRYRIPARLFIDPTDCDADWTSGAPNSGLGTQLGICERIAVSLTQVTVNLASKTKGTENMDRLIRTESLVISFFERSLDPDLLGLLYGSDVNTTTTASTEPLVARVAFFAGKLKSGIGKKILLAPLDPEVHPGFLIYNGVAETEGESVFVFDQDFGRIVKIYALPDATNRFYQMGKLQDFTL